MSHEDPHTDECALIHSCGDKTLTHADAVTAGTNHNHNNEMLYSNLPPKFNSILSISLFQTSNP